VAAEVLLSARAERVGRNTEGGWRRVHRRELWEASSCRNRNCKLLETEFRLIIYRRAHRVTTSSWGIGKSRRARAIITAFRVGDDGGRVFTDGRFDRCATRPLFYGVIEATIQEKAQAQIQNADHKSDEDRGNHGKFDRRRASPVYPCNQMNIMHG
jgi:hypothetical protein